MPAHELDEKIVAQVATLVKIISYKQHFDQPFVATDLRNAARRLAEYTEERRVVSEERYAGAQKTL